MKQVQTNCRSPVRTAASAIAASRLLSPRLPREREGEAPAEPDAGNGSAGASPSHRHFPLAEQDWGQAYIVSLGSGLQNSVLPA